MDKLTRLIDKLDQLDDTPAHLLNCTLSSKYDVIGFEFNIYNNSFELSKNLVGYKHMDDFTVPGETQYLPDWDVHKYRNITTKNLIFFAMSSRIMKGEEVFLFGASRKVKKPQYIVRIFFHGEKTPLTMKEINSFLDIVIKTYSRFVKGINSVTAKDKRVLEIPRPNLFVAEVAVDFKGPAVYYLYEDFSSNLYRKRSKERNEYAGETIDPETGETIVNKKCKFKKPIKKTYDNRILFNHLSTSYISEDYRDYTFDVIMKKTKTDERGKTKIIKDAIATFRFEMIIRKRYLRNKKILTLDDLEKKLDVSKYWYEHFHFFKFDEKKIGAYLTKHYPHLVIPVLSLLLPNAFHKPHQIYDILKTYSVKHKGSKKEKRVFNYPSRQLITTKWFRLDLMIQNALRTLSLSGSPADKEIGIRPRDLQKIKPDGRSERKKQEVIDAVVVLRKQGIQSSDLSVRDFAKKAGVSPKTAQTYKYLWKITGAIPPHNNNYVNSREK